MMNNCNPLPTNTMLYFAGLLCATLVTQSIFFLIPMLAFWGLASYLRFKP